jgi:hypothetical protein
MLNNKSENKLNILFLHFANMSKVIKDKKYISRNGKFPGFEDRNISNKGYQFSYLITLRKYLEGHMGKKDIKLEKRKDQLQYAISLKEREYDFGSNPFLDSQIKLKLFSDRGLLGSLDQFGSAGFVRDNHNIKIQAPLSGTNRANSTGFKATYNFDLFCRDQVYANVFFDDFQAFTELKLQESGSRSNEKEILKAELSSLFQGLDRANLLRKNYLSTKKVAKRAEAIRASSRIESRMDRLATKYSMTAEEVRTFIESWQRLINDSEGVTEGQLFEFQKQVTYNASGNRNFRRFEYNDFEEIA